MYVRTCNSNKCLCNCSNYVNSSCPCSFLIWILKSNDVMTCFLPKSHSYPARAPNAKSHAMIWFRWGRVRGTWKCIGLEGHSYMFPAACIVCLRVMRILIFWHAGMGIPAYMTWSGWKWNRYSMRSLPQLRFVVAATMRITLCCPNHTKEWWVLETAYQTSIQLFGNFGMLQRGTFMWW